MIKNLELTIFKQSDIFEAENFSREFSGTMYYFLYKLKKIQILKCSYIDISLINKKIADDFNFTLKSGVLYLSGSHNFDSYILLNRKEKLQFQYILICDILKIIFNKYEIDVQQLDSIKHELSTNNGQMKIKWKLKGIEKKFNAHIIIKIDIDNFTFYLEITEGKSNYVIKIFKSIPLYLSVMFFTVYKIEGNKIKIGSREGAVFEVDILKRESVIINNNKAVESLKFT